MNASATNHPISWFKDFYVDNRLDLTPNFQRKPVWSDAQASYLVDSILNDLPVPEIFVRTITNAEGKARLEVVDGQQRLRSIIRFFTGDLVLSGELVTSEWEGKSWEDLSTDDYESFWTYKLVVRELEGASDLEVTDMFRRLNANQSNLNPQELRHSQYSGDFITLVEELAGDRWWLDNKIVTPAQIRRMKDAEFVSELLVGLMSGPLNKKIGLEDYYADYNDDFADADYWRSKFVETKKMTSKICDGDLGSWKTKTEYYSLFLACGRLILDDYSIDQEAKERLSKFKDLADEAKKKDAQGNYPTFIKDYVEAVTRASTDLGRRLKRIEVVEDIIKGSLDLP
jgi:hypothetical protein